MIVGLAVVGLGFIAWHPEGLRNRHSDLVAYHLGMQTVVHDVWQADRRLALWRPDILSGEPAFTNPQSLSTHPFHLLFLFFEPDRVVGLVMWLQFLLVGLGAYWSTAVLRVSVASRLLIGSAALFSFKIILAAYAGWLVPLAAIAALPLVFGALARAFARPSLAAALLLGGVGTVALHAGQLQFVYYAALFGVVCSVVRVGQFLAARDRSNAVRLTAVLVLGALIAAGLSAHVLVPLAQDATLITRTAADYTYFLGDPRLSRLGLLTVANPALLGGPLEGGVIESWEYVAFFGAVTTVLATVGAIGGRRRVGTRVILAVVVASVLLATDTPVLRFAFDWIPGYALFRMPSRILFLTAFFVCVLAGIGLDVILRACPGALSLIHI